ncbi:UvrD-helicase domain-containing protein [Salicibibacter kimchii]|uniref:ATP-dependent helicase n=1 Tax=Salicibibacter kimchii TaxID=2099786 RepID=A0A345BWH2_9BACI|nr:UvrD-helicase domain-containing protein [Salicibibacter kimchii]AXF55303.1 ATP-dependent helicase [Salicibibacter kimchii]
MTHNKLTIAAAGAGKTTHLIEQALLHKDEPILITTYTQANEAQIRRKIIKKNKCIPQNIKIQTWFSLLLQHGVRPYQSYLFDEKIKGMLLVNKKSGFKYYNKKKDAPVYYKEKEVKKHYFTNDHKIYSDKVSKFVVKCNMESNGEVIKRLSRIFTHIYVDEVQDLAGYDLEIIKLLLKSNSKIHLVGDPRQVTYLTHHENKHNKYREGKIKDFIENECGSICDIDEKTLNSSHRNNQEICDFASKLYPEFPKSRSNQNIEANHNGVFLVKNKDLEKYLELYEPVQLRENVKTKVNNNYKVVNFGESKGLTYDRVLIYPTKPYIDWLKNNDTELKSMSRSKFYVAITRAKHSVAIVYDFDETTNIEGVEKFED